MQWDRNQPLPNDTELLDHLDRLTCEALTVELHRIWTNPPYSWQVGTKYQFEGKTNSMSGSGGGMNAREALWNAIKNQGVAQNKHDVERVVEKLSK